MITKDSFTNVHYKKLPLENWNTNKVVNVADCFKQPIQNMPESDITRKIPEQKRDIFESKRELCYDKI